MRHFELNCALGIRDKWLKISNPIFHSDIIEDYCKLPKDDSCTKDFTNYVIIMNQLLSSEKVYFDILFHTCKPEWKWRKKYFGNLEIKNLDNFLCNCNASNKISSRIKEKNATEKIRPVCYIVSLV